MQFPQKSQKADSLPWSLVTPCPQYKTAAKNCADTLGVNDIDPDLVIGLVQFTFFNLFCLSFFGKAVNKRPHATPLFGRGVNVRATSTAL